MHAAENLLLIWSATEKVDIFCIEFSACYKIYVLLKHDWNIDCCHLHCDRAIVIATHDLIFTDNEIKLKKWEYYSFVGSFIPSNIYSPRSCSLEMAWTGRVTVMPDEIYCLSRYNANVDCLKQHVPKIEHLTSVCQIKSKSLHKASWFGVCTVCTTLGIHPRQELWKHLLKIPQRMSQKRL